MVSLIIEVSKYLLILLAAIYTMQSYVADTQGIYLSADGEEFSMFEGEVLSSRRYLDMEGGYTGREVTWRSPKGREMRITVKRMTSFEKLTLFTIEYTVEALNFEGNVLLHWESLNKGAL